MGILKDAIKRDLVIQRLEKKIRNGSGKFRDVQALTSKTGDVTGKLITDALNEEFSNGKIPEDDVRRIISPILKEQHQYISEITGLVVDASYKKAGVGLKAIMPDYNIWRENDIVKEISERSFRDDRQE